MYYVNEAGVHDDSAASDLYTFQHMKIQFMQHKPLRLSIPDCEYDQVSM